MGPIDPLAVDELLTDEEGAIAETVRKYADAQLAPRITVDHTVMRHMNNFETVMTYEGTEEMHALSIGAAVTGIPAFR